MICSLVALLLVCSVQLGEAQPPLGTTTTTTTVFIVGATTVPTTSPSTTGTTTNTVTPSTSATTSGTTSGTTTPPPAQRYAFEVPSDVDVGEAFVFAVTIRDLNDGVVEIDGSISLSYVSTWQHAAGTVDAPAVLNITNGLGSTIMNVTRPGTLKISMSEIIELDLIRAVAQTININSKTTTTMTTTRTTSGTTTGTTTGSTTATEARVGTKIVFDAPATADVGETFPVIVRILDSDDLQTKEGAVVSVDLDPVWNFHAGSLSGPTQLTLVDGEATGLYTASRGGSLTFSLTLSSGPSGLSLPSSVDVVLDPLTTTGSTTGTSTGTTSIEKTTSPTTTGTTTGTATSGEAYTWGFTAPSLGESDVPFVFTVQALDFDFNLAAGYDADLDLSVSVVWDNQVGVITAPTQISVVDSVGTATIVVSKKAQITLRVKDNNTPNLVVPIARPTVTIDSASTTGSTTGTTTDITTGTTTGTTSDATTGTTTGTSTGTTTGTSTGTTTGTSTGTTTGTSSGTTTGTSEPVAFVLGAPTAAKAKEDFVVEVKAVDADGNDVAVSASVAITLDEDQLYRSGSSAPTLLTLVAGKAEGTFNVPVQGILGISITETSSLGLAMPAKKFIKLNAADDETIAGGLAIVVKTIALDQACGSTTIADLKAVVTQVASELSVTEDKIELSLTCVGGQSFFDGLVASRRRSTTPVMEISVATTEADSESIAATLRTSTCASEAGSNSLQTGSGVNFQDSCDDAVISTATSVGSAAGGGGGGGMIVIVAVIMVLIIVGIVGFFVYRRYRSGGSDSGTSVKEKQTRVSRPDELNAPDDTQAGAGYMSVDANKKPGDSGYMPVNPKKEAADLDEIVVEEGVNPAIFGKKMTRVHSKKDITRKASKKDLAIEARYQLQDEIAALEATMERGDSIEEIVVEADVNPAIFNKKSKLTRVHSKKKLEKSSSKKDLAAETRYQMQDEMAALEATLERGEDVEEIVVDADVNPAIFNSKSKLTHVRTESSAPALNDEELRDELQEECAEFEEELRRDGFEG